MTKRLRKIKKYIYCTNKHLLILNVMFTDVDLCINASISKWIICKHNFSLPLLTSNVPFQIGKSTPWGTCIPACAPLVWYYLRLGFKAGVTNLLPQTQSCYLVQIHAKVYQVDTHTSENKNLLDLSSYDVIIKKKLKIFIIVKKLIMFMLLSEQAMGNPHGPYWRSGSGGHHVGDPWFRLSTLGY